MNTKLPSVAAFATAKIYEVSGEYATVGVGIEASAPIKKYSGTIVIYDIGIVNKYERSRKDITMRDPAGTKYLDNEYSMYVGSANRVRFQLTNSTFEDTYGRVGSMVPLWSGYFDR